MGGERVGSEGNYVSPALFTGENHMRIAQEEIFGPVLTAIPFKNEADALAKANDVKYGLASYIWTSDVTRAHRMALALEAGMTWINSHNVRHLPDAFWRSQIQRHASRRRRALFRVLYRAQTHRGPARFARDSQIWKRAWKFNSLVSFALVTWFSRCRYCGIAALLRRPPRPQRRP